MATRSVWQGSRGPSRASRIGEAFGGGMAAAFIPAMQEERQNMLMSQRFDPIRESLMQSAAGMPSGPMADTLRAITSSPSAFAQLMQDPQQLSAVSSMAGAMQPAAPAEFTLGPNETRFRGDEIIAQGAGVGAEPTFPQIEEINAALIQAEQARAQGRTRAAELLEARAAHVAGEDPGALSNAAKMVRDMGLNPAEGRGLELMQMQIEGSRQRSANQERVQLLTERGMDPQLAEDLVYGFVDREFLPELGVWRTTNTLTGAVTELPAALNPVLSELPAEGAPLPPGSEEVSLWDLAPVASGPGASIRAGYENLMGFVGADREGAVTQARQVFQTAVRDMIRAFSINPRFPVAEQERIRDEIGRYMPNFFRGEQTVRDRMVALHFALTDDMERYLQTAQDTRIPADSRQAFLQAANDISMFLDRLGVPPEALESSPVLRQGAAPRDGLPEGIPEGSEALGTLPSGARAFRLPDGSTKIVEG